jgi:hypothetical protein
MTTALGAGTLLSASQISVFRECKRKWGFGYILGIRTPSTPSQALGTEVDDNQLQPYLREGRALDLSRESGHIAATGLPFLPEAGACHPKTGIGQVQKHFILPSPSKLFSYQGYIDLWLPKRGLPNMPSCKVHEDCIDSPLLAEACYELHDGKIVPIVSDFKTTSNMSYAKGSKELAVDVQAQLYSVWAMWETQARIVDLAWVYMQTKGARKAQRSLLRVDSAHVLQQFLTIDATGQEIYETKQSATGRDPDAFVMSLPPSPEACDNFGGCPHRHRCNLGPSDFVDSLTHLETTQEKIIVTSALAAKLNARKAAAVAAPTPAPAPAPATITSEVAINPPEVNLPPPPPAVEAAPAPKRGRPKKTATDSALVIPTAPANTEVSSFIFEALEEIGDVFHRLSAQLRRGAK